MSVVAHDAHVHIDPKPGGDGTRLPEYIADRDRLGIGLSAIVTPSTHGWDNTVSFAAAATDPERFRVIARVDLRADDAVAATQAVLDEGASGLRVTLMGNDDITWLNDGSIDDGLRTLAAAGGFVEFHAAPEQHGDVARFAERMPDITIVLDHMGRPDVGEGVDGPRFASYLELRRHPQIYAKTPNSSFFSRGAAPYSDLVPFWERTLEVFGPSRLMWASDWPLCVTRDPFTDTIHPLVDVLGGTDNPDAVRILRGTFEKVFGVTA